MKLLCELTNSPTAIGRTRVGGPNLPAQLGTTRTRQRAMDGFIWKKRGFI
jgi:hypothetical protein